MSSPDQPRINPSLQAVDENLDESLDETVAYRRRRAAHRRNQTIEAYVRHLIQRGKDLVAQGDSEELRAVLDDLHTCLTMDEDLDAVLDPRQRLIEERADISESDAAQVRAAFRRHMRLRDRGRLPDPEAELRVAAKVGRALEYYSSISDMTWYDEVRFSRIDPAPGKASKDVINPIGKIRIGANEPIGPGDRLPVIEHKSCEHILAVALPRQGKDSTNVSICSSLMEEHRYKWISLWDDGRDETPMISTPADEDAIKKNLEGFGEEPRGYPTRVYVPAMDGLPRELPGNFEPFTIGVDSLTGKMILRLGGFNADRNTISRVEEALAQARRAKSGNQIKTLIGLLEKYSEDLIATVTITELADDGLDPEDVDDGEVVSNELGHQQIQYEMDSNKVLKKCAETVLYLAAEGLLAESGAETNLDMVEEIRANDRVAVLNCNYLEARNEPLKFLIANLWLRLLLTARDKDKSLPRVALEIRELKNIAPSVLGMVDYSDEVKNVRQTLYEIATQGGSRRIMMVGSTQKLNDVAKPVRSNMPIKIFLKLDPGLVKLMDDEMRFPYALKEQLEGFSPGQGAIKIDESFFWPITFRGAPCGLGAGDVPFERRYAQAMGFRIREWDRDGFDGDEDSVWIDHRGRTHPGDKPPGVDVWYLLDEDLEAIGVDVDLGDQVDDDDVRAAAVERQEYPVPDDLIPRPTALANQRRDLRLQTVDEIIAEQRRSMVSSTPSATMMWHDVSESKLRRMLTVLEEIDALEYSRQKDIAEEVDLTEATLSRYLNDEDVLGRCVRQVDGVFVLTRTGREVLEERETYLGHAEEVTA